MHVRIAIFGAGFCATIVADNLGHLRHMALSPDGTIYANTWSGQYYVGQPPPPGADAIRAGSRRTGGRE